MLPHAVCILVGRDRHEPPNEWKCQGSGTLVLLAEAGPLLVTARHVYDDFCRLRSSSPSAAAALIGSKGSPVLLDSLEPLGYDPGIDAIGIRLSQSPDLARIGRRFLCIRPWFQQVTVGERCVFLAAPAEHTSIYTSEMELDWDVADITATDVDGREILLAPISDGERVVVRGDIVSDAPSDWHGISGAGLYAFRKDRLEFAGVIYGGTGGYGKDTTFRAYHADLIPLR